ncbi:MAG: MOSC N-terminal beta barrel domain-containing protein [Candidatus Dormibacteraeota bacterium]|nr:MOSC N-terminal beta barrel domain-containing protein [Candidatus Dormibacteraeota bacterium]
MPDVGTIAAIHRYPVKSMQGETLPTASLGPVGIAGDRHWAVRDRASGKVLSGKREARLMMASARMVGASVEITPPGDEALLGDDPSTDERLSRWLNREVVLDVAKPQGDEDAFYEFQLDGDERAEVLDLPVMDGSYFDLAPVHLLTSASLKTAAALEPAISWDVCRFRPTVLVDTELEGFAEDAWTGRIQVGGATCAVLMPTIRCAMPMRPQPGLPAPRD